MFFVHQRLCDGRTEQGRVAVVMYSLNLDTGWLENAGGIILQGRREELYNLIASGVVHG